MKTTIYVLSFLLFWVLNGQAEVKGKPISQAVQKLVAEEAKLKEKIAKFKARQEAKNEFSLFSSRHPDCDDDPSPRTCVRNCASRYSDGSCARYNADYCGPDASCSPHCASRYSDGSCARYNADFCGPNASCSENCESRYSDGSCARYGADVCY